MKINTALEGTVSLLTEKSVKKAENQGNEQCRSGKKGDIVMASNFRISVQRNSHGLELRLNGDFDGTSACELLNALKEKCNDADRVLIHTSGLKVVYPFGRDTFQNNLYTLKDKRIHFTFTGEKAMEIGPEASILF